MSTDFSLRPVSSDAVATALRSFAWGTGDIRIVPEPSGLILLGMVGLLARRRAA